MASDVFARLDEIDRSSGRYSDLVLEAGKLMESFASGTDELISLIDRYGRSVTPSIANPLAFMVAVRAQRPTQEMAKTVLHFIKGFGCWEHPSTVTNCLTAVQHCLHYVDAAAEALRYLSPFLRKSLEYNGRHWVIIKGHALGLLPIIVRRDLINAIFTPEEFLEVREEIRELRRTAATELGPELEDLKGLIEE